MRVAVCCVLINASCFNIPRFWRGLFLQVCVNFFVDITRTLNTRNYEAIMYVDTEEVLHKLLNNTLKLNTAYVQALRAYKRGYYKQHKIIRAAIKQYNAINKLQNLQL